VETGCRVAEKSGRQVHVERHQEGETRREAEESMMGTYYTTSRIGFSGRPFAAITGWLCQQSGLRA
jgi:hypothetical protein